MSSISYIQGIINTKKNIPLYIKDYYANGHIIKFTLSNNENENMKFSGKKLSKMALTSPNFNPLFNIRDILKNCNETKYLNYKSITYTETKYSNITNSDNIIKRLPPSYYKHKEIKKNTKIEITDNVNNIILTFLYN